eukprot:CAMPEP_0174730318 /NCGR_PEP_ID=MMETSP1094-20130205/55344_1 /TAXON_ID=156173 /ORGANISM="Chrysochromulina brevifilum, Strain UTEX LB 985" /LENGTH=155 /DNA_ID=CAMNT_0015932557 /DNA_START=135 /DNA_END=602 /DNA_ORIENTATION=-
MIYVNAIIGIAAVLSRIVLLLVFNVLYLPRLDQSLMPGPEGTLYQYDAGFGAYVAMLALDHRYNNPVGMCFTELLINTLRARRAAKIVQRVILRAPARKAAALAISLRAVAHRRWLRARNRWQLALFLLHNPLLRAERRQAFVFIRKETPVSCEV